MSTNEDKVIELDVTIKGKRPLLMHSNAEILQPKSNKIKSSEHDIEEDAKKCLYFDDNKKIAVPSLAILAAMRKAAVNLKKAGAGKKTLKDYVYSGINIDPFMIELTPQEYTTDVQVVVVNRSRIPRARSLFKNWMLQFKLTIVDTQTWDVGKVREVLDDAGKYQGLLDFRPLYGTFEVESMKTPDGLEVK